MKRICRYWREAFIGVASVVVVWCFTDVARVLWWVVRESTKGAGADG